MRKKKKKKKSGPTGPTIKVIDNEKSQKNTKEILILRKISRTEARCLQIERARHMDAKKIQTMKRKTECQDIRDKAMSL